MGNLARRIKEVRAAARLSQEKFAEALGDVEGVKITRGAVGNWEVGGGISRANLTAISVAFDVPLDWLERGIGEPDLEKAQEKNVSKFQNHKDVMYGSKHSRPDPKNIDQNARIGTYVTGFTRVPIRGQGMGGMDGALIFNTDQNMGDILAPPILFDVPEAYAVYVAGDSMLERFRDGEVVFVHPHLRVRRDDDCVIQIAMGEGHPNQGWVKRFVSMDDKTLKVRQLNPRKVLTFPVNRVVSIHRIVMAGPV